MEIRINISKLIDRINLYKIIKNKIIKDDLNLLNKWNNHIDIINGTNSTCYLLKSNLIVKYSFSGYKIIHYPSKLVLGKINYYTHKITLYSTNILSLIFNQYDINIDWNKRLISRFANNTEYICGKPIHIYYNLINFSFAFIFNDDRMTNEFKLKIRNCSGIIYYFIDTLKILLLGR